MQPQNSPSPTPQYDFILNEQKQPAKSRFGFFKKLPKPALMILALGVLFIGIILILGLSNKGPSQPQPLVRAAGRAQEISRISGLVQAQTKDPDTQSLAATAKLVLASEQGQLREAGGSISAERLTVYENKKTDEELTQAVRENRLEEVYNTYLKASLNSYKSDLQSARASVTGTGRTIIEAALKNADMLLAAPQLAGS